MHAKPLNRCQSYRGEYLNQIRSWQQNLVHTGLCQSRPCSKFLCNSDRRSLKSYLTQILVQIKSCGHTKGRGACESACQSESERASERERERARGRESEREREREREGQACSPSLDLFCVRGLRLFIRSVLARIIRSGVVLCRIFVAPAPPSPLRRGLCLGGANTSWVEPWGRVAFLL